MHLSHFRRRFSSTANRFTAKGIWHHYRCSLWQLLAPEPHKTTVHILPVILLRFCRCERAIISGGAYGIDSFAQGALIAEEVRAVIASESMLTIRQECTSL